MFISGVELSRIGNEAELRGACGTTIRDDVRPAADTPTHLFVIGGAKQWRSGTAAKQREALGQTIRGGSTPAITILKHVVFIGGTERNRRLSREVMGETCISVRRAFLFLKF